MKQKKSILTLMRAGSVRRISLDAAGNSQAPAWFGTGDPAPAGPLIAGSQTGATASAGAGSAECHIPEAEPPRLASTGPQTALAADAIAGGGIASPIPRTIGSQFAAAPGSQPDQTPRCLQNTLMHLAERLPDPSEKLTRVRPTDIGSLLQAIDLADTNPDLIRLAHSLTSWALASIFPALTLPDLTRRQVDCLYLIIRERACQSLYHYGWHVLQQVYPSLSVGKGLAVLCGVLAIKQAGQETGSLGSLPLVSQIAAPQSRQFPRKIMEGLIRENLPLAWFMHEYQLLPATALGTELAETVFLTGPASLFPGSALLFAQMLGAAQPAGQAALLRHFLNLAELSSDVRQQFQTVILHQLGSPNKDHPVWSLLHAREKRPFLEWDLRAVVSSHFRGNPAKASFYLRYADHLRRVEYWDQETVLFYFTRFVIADQLSWPDQALYYDQPEANEHPLGLAKRDASRNPASPAIPHIRVEEALRRGSTDGVIQLLFDAEGIKLSGVLLDFALQQQRRHRSAPSFPLT